MALFETIPTASRTLRVLARLLSYPGPETRANLDEMAAALAGEAALGTPRRTELQGLMESIARRPPLDVEAEYVELFDRGRSTSLHLFEHVHGDSRERGPAMVDLRRTYESAGLHLAPGELPDYLPVVLEFASTQPPREARALLGEFVHLLNALFTALHRQRSAYAIVIAALIELAGGKAEAVAIVGDEPIDESWAEPPVFGGCSALGQTRPEQAQAIAQPIHFVSRTSVAGGIQA